MFLPARNGSLKIATGCRYMSELEPSAWYVLEPSKFHTGQSEIEQASSSYHLQHYHHHHHYYIICSTIIITIIILSVAISPAALPSSYHLQHYHHHDHLQRNTIITVTIIRLSAALSSSYHLQYYHHCHHHHIICSTINTSPSTALSSSVVSDLLDMPEVCTMGTGQFTEESTPN